MIGIVLLAAAASGSAERPPDLIELSGIVAPYATCESKHDAEVKAAHDRWLPAEQRKFAEPNNSAAVAEAAKQFEAVQTLHREIQKSCGFEETHEQLRNRLMALHPGMDSSRAFWLARGVFVQLNSLNEQLLKLRAGIFPAPSPPPPAPPPIAKESK